MKNTEENSEIIWKTSKKVVKRYEKYGGRKKRNDMENMEERQIES